MPAKRSAVEVSVGFRPFEPAVFRKTGVPKGISVLSPLGREMTMSSTAREIAPG